MLAIISAKSTLDNISNCKLKNDLGTVLTIKHNLLSFTCHTPVNLFITRDKFAGFR